MTVCVSIVVPDNRRPFPSYLETLTMILKEYETLLIVICHCMSSAVWLLFLSTFGAETRLFRYLASAAFADLQ